MISTMGFEEFFARRETTNVQVDVTRVASQVVVGIGFLGAGHDLPAGVGGEEPDHRRPACGPPSAVGWPSAWAHPHRRDRRLASCWPAWSRCGPCARGSTGGSPTTSTTSGSNCGDGVEPDGVIDALTARRHHRHDWCSRRTGRYVLSPPVGEHEVEDGHGAITRRDVVASSTTRPRR